MRTPIGTTAAMLFAAALLGGCANSEKHESQAQTHEKLDGNLITDPGFDNTPQLHDDEGLPPAEWGAEENGGTPSISSNGRRGDGDNVAQLAGYAPQLFQIFDADPNTTYQVSFWYSYNAQSGDSASVILHDWCNNDADGDGDSIDQCPVVGTMSLDPTSDWQQATFTANAGSLSFGRMFILFESDSASGASLFIDDVSVVEQGQPPTCNCNGTDVNGNPVSSTVCGSTVCASDQQIWQCTENDYQPTGQSCGGTNNNGSCTSKYGGTNGFQLCFESSTECGFEAVKDSTQSCDDVCSAAGGQCLRVQGNDSSDPCTATSDKPDACSDATTYDDICVCSP